MTLVNQLDGRGELALDIALCAQQTSIARTLVEHQADLNARDTRDYTLLHRAVERGVYSTVTYIRNFMEEKQPD